MTDDELFDMVDEVPDELLLLVAHNGLGMAVERRFDPCKREANRNACVIALGCLGRLLDLPEMPDAELCERARRDIVDERKRRDAP